jgi:hypothetical protein
MLSNAKCCVKVGAGSRIECLEAGRSGKLGRPIISRRDRAIQIADLDSL